MIKQGEMNKSVFHDNLILTINEIMGDMRLDSENLPY